MRANLLTKNCTHYSQSKTEKLNKSQQQQQVQRHRDNFNQSLRMYISRENHKQRRVMIVIAQKFSNCFPSHPYETMTKRKCMNYIERKLARNQWLVDTKQIPD